MSSKDEMLDEFGTVLGVSDWWEHNWDALVDVLRDCWYHSTDLRVLVFHHAEHIGSADDDAFATLMSILRSVV